MNQPNVFPLRLGEVLGSMDCGAVDGSVGLPVSIMIRALETDPASCSVLPLIPDITAMGAERSA